MTTVDDVCRVAETLWPEAGAEDWDSVGLVVGARLDSVTHILLTVDVTPAVISDAHDLGADFVVSHHPLLLRGVTSIAEETYKGACVTQLVRCGMGLLTAHTNADVVPGGVSDVLAQELKLNSCVPIISRGSEDPVGLGRVGNLDEPIPLLELAQRLGSILPSTASGIRVSGEPTRAISRVALCGGAGDSLLGEAAVRDADVFVTSDLRHHPASEFREWSQLNAGPALIDVSHWASEWLWLNVAAQAMRSALPAVTVSVSDVRTDPWDFSVVQ